MTTFTKAMMTITGVHPCVFREANPLREHLAADITGERFLACVYSDMALQRAAAGESLLADAAGERFLTGVHTDVSGQVSSLCERLAAKGTAERTRFDRRTGSWHPVVYRGAGRTVRSS